MTLEKVDMDWIKIEKGSLITADNFLVTDGKEIGIQYHAFRGSKTPSVKNWTHYIPFDSIKLPKE